MSSTTVPAKLVPLLSQLFPSVRWPPLPRTNSLACIWVQIPFFAPSLATHSPCLRDQHWGLSLEWNSLQNHRDFLTSAIVGFSPPECSLTACMGWRSQSPLPIKPRNNPAPSKADQLALQPWDWWMESKNGFWGKSCKAASVSIHPIWDYLLPGGLLAQTGQRAAVGHVQGCQEAQPCTLLLLRPSLQNRAQACSTPTSGHKRGSSRTLVPQEHNLLS